MIQFRHAAEADIESLTRLRLAFLRELGTAGDEHPTEALEAATWEYFARTLATQEFVAFVAECDGQIIATSGMVFFERPPYGGNLRGRAAYLLNIYTDPAWRGLGLAGALLAEVTAFARSTGTGCLRLHASAAGRTLYDRAGFAARSNEMVLSL